MIRRLILFLIAATTFCGGVYLFRTRRSGLAPRAHGVIHTADASPAETAGQRRIRIPHLVGLIVTTVVLGGAAYFGLGYTADVAARSQPLPSDVNPSLREEVRANVSQSHSGKTDSVPTPAPAYYADELLPSGRRMRSDVSPAIQIPTDGFEAIICAKPWPCAEAIKVASCESGLDRHGRLDGNWARNGNNYGLFQINGVHAHRWPNFSEDWMDPVQNTEWAFQIWSTSGWVPWECNPKLVRTLNDSGDGASTLPTDTPTETPSPDDSMTPTPTPPTSPDDSATPTPIESPVVEGSASPTPSPDSSPLPTPTPTP